MIEILEKERTWLVARKSLLYGIFPFQQQLKNIYANISCHAQLSTKLLDSVERDWTKFLNMLLWKEYM